MIDSALGRIAHAQYCCVAAAFKLQRSSISFFFHVKTFVLSGAMSSGEDIAGGASFSDGQTRQQYARKGHRKSVLHANIAESLKIRQAS